MKRSKILLLSVVVSLALATTASALVTVDATTTFAGPIFFGATFDVDISVTWDGSGSLTGVFTSHTWDNSQLALIGADSTIGAPGMFETRPQILDGTSFEPVYQRFGTIAAGIAGDDLSSSARTVQYGGLAAAASSRAGTNLVVRLTFQIIGVGDGVVDITGAHLLGDIGASGDSFAFGSNVSFPLIPEPATGLLLGLGLAFLGCTKRRSDRGFGHKLA